MFDPLGLELDLAVKNGRVVKVKELLARGADVNFRNEYGATPLIEASLRGYQTVVKALLEHGADIGGVETASGSTALSRAALTGHAEVAELLLEAGADIDARDFDGRTALFEAALSGHLQVVVILLARGADVHVRDISGRTALTEANVWGEAKVAELLIKSGAHVETTAEEMMHRNWIPDRCGPIDASRTSLELLENH